MIIVRGVHSQMVMKSLGGAVMCYFNDNKNCYYNWKNYQGYSGCGGYVQTGFCPCCGKPCGGNQKQCPEQKPCSNWQNYCPQKPECGKNTIKFEGIIKFC